MAESVLYELTVKSKCTKCGHYGLVKIKLSDSTPLDIGHAVCLAMRSKSDYNDKSKSDDSRLVDKQLPPCPNCLVGGTPSNGNATMDTASYDLTDILNSPLTGRIPLFHSVSVPDIVSSPTETTFTRSSSDSKLRPSNGRPELNYQHHIFFIDTECKTILAALKKQKSHRDWFALVSPENTTEPPFIVISWMFEPNYASIEYDRRKHVKIRFHNNTCRENQAFDSVSELLAYYKSHKNPSGGIMSRQLRKEQVLEADAVRR